MLETGWDWDAYMDTPLSVVEAVKRRLEKQAQQRERDARKSKRRGPR